MSKNLIVAADHAGVGLKRKLAEVARELGYDVDDLGTHTDEATDYPVRGSGSWSVGPGSGCRWPQTGTKESARLLAAIA